MMVPQQPLGLLPQLVADSLDHHDLLHQLRQGSRQLMLDQRLVGQVRGGAPGTLAQQLDIRAVVCFGMFIWSSRIPLPLQDMAYLSQLLKSRSKGRKSVYK